MGTTEITVTPGTQQVVITREFDAPRELVFRAYTDPELFVQWMGPRYLTTTVEQFDVRDGGRWQYVAAAPDGSEHRFHGVFHGDPSPERIVQTFEYEGAPTHVSLETAVFTESAGRTLVTPPRCSSPSRTATRWSPPGWRAVLARATTGSVSS